MSDVVSQIIGQQEAQAEQVDSEVQLKQALQDESQKPDNQERQEKPKYDEFASKFAALSRKEKQMREKEQQLEARMKQLEEESSKKLEPYKKYDGFEDRLKSNPLSVLQEYGITPDTLATMLLEGDGKPSVETQLQKLEANYKQEMEKLRKELEDKDLNRQKEVQEQVLSNFKADIRKYVEAEAEYELIRENDAFDLVFDVVDAQFKKDGTVLSIKDASDKVETYLLEEAKKLFKIQKLQSLVHPKEASSSEQANKDDKQTLSATLSNSQSTQVPTRSEQQLSETERKREAAKLLRWDA